MSEPLWDMIPYEPLYRLQGKEYARKVENEYSTFASQRTEGLEEIRKSEARWICRILMYLTDLIRFYNLSVADKCRVTGKKLDCPDVIAETILLTFTDKTGESS